MRLRVKQRRRINYSMRVTRATFLKAQLMSWVFSDGTGNQVLTTPKGLSLKYHK